jgi:glycosyltransferase involved in cell wall biosynthesis
MTTKRMILVWYHFSRRAEQLAGELDADLVLIYEPRFRTRRTIVLAYLIQAVRTWRALDHRKPEMVLVQVPPIFAALTVACWCRVRGGRQARFALDCHTGAFYGDRWRWALSLLRRLSRQAAVTTTSDEPSGRIVGGWSARGFYLPDRVPRLSPPSGAIGKDGAARIAVITTFEKTDPIGEILAAARMLPEVTFYMTGDPARAPADVRQQRPENAVLTGYLRGGEYSGLLHNVHGLLILTERPDDVSCGAFEAIAAKKPAILSDWPEMRRTFTRGFIFVPNTAEQIAAGVRDLLQRRDSLVPDMARMQVEFADQRQPQLDRLVALLQ